MSEKEYKPLKSVRQVGHNRPNKPIPNSSLPIAWRGRLCQSISAR